MDGLGRSCASPPHGGWERCNDTALARLQNTVRLEPAAIQWQPLLIASSPLFATSTRSKKSQQSSRKPVLGSRQCMSQKAKKRLRPTASASRHFWGHGELPPASLEWLPTSTSGWVRYLYTRQPDLVPVNPGPWGIRTPAPCAWLSTPPYMPHICIAKCC
jgi:hypothetical protein